MVDVRAFEKHSPPGMEEDVCPEGNLRRKVHPGRVPRREIARAKEDPSRNRSVRGNFFATREIPLPDGGLETSSVHRVVQREDRIYGHEIDCPFQIAASPSGKAVLNQDAADTPAQVDKTRIIDGRQARSAPAE